MKLFSFLKYIKPYKALIYNHTQDNILLAMVIGISLLFWVMIMGIWFVKLTITAEGFRFILVLTALWLFPTIYTIKEMEDKKQL